jgi:GNAT superfamily N-acetyltransferase
VHQLTFKSATILSLEELANAFNAAFAGYFYPQSLTGATLARRVRLEQIDLEHSLLAYDGEEFAGLSLLGIRGERGWCGGFGIVAGQRGRGRARELMNEFMAEARRRELKKLSLEVLARNTPARKLYERAGMKVTRDLPILGRDLEADTSNHSTELAEAAPASLLRHFERLHTHAPAWQRELPSLLTTDGARGFCLGEVDAPRAYALLVANTDGLAHLIDLAASDHEAASALCAGLRKLPYNLRVVNEPEDSMFIAALAEHGFVEKDRQHEMACELL